MLIITTINKVNKAIINSNGYIRETIFFQPYFIPVAAMRSCNASPIYTHRRTPSPSSDLFSGLWTWDDPSNITRSTLSLSTLPQLNHQGDVCHVFLPLCFNLSFSLFLSLFPLFLLSNTLYLLSFLIYLSTPSHFHLSVSFFCSVFPSPAPEGFFFFVCVCVCVYLFLRLPH